MASVRAGTGAHAYAGGAGHANNKQAQLANAYQELGKELASENIKIVGGYTIGRVIGEGSFGAVHLAIHRLTGTRCAIKKIPKRLSSQVTREIHHHRRLHHLHIVQLYEIIATETYVWLVAELCSGGELFDYLVERGRMLEGEARRLFGELTVAVGFMHKEGTVHRDLKLENVLLDGELRVKLADLGFAREWHRGKLMETYCGTTGYASPEMLAGRKYLGVETDIWSLGIILYTLLCGGLPFDDDDERVMQELIQKGEYEEPEWLSEEARSLIKLLLSHNPSDRPSIEGVLTHPWFRITIIDNLPGGHSVPSSPHPQHASLPAEDAHFSEPWTKHVHPHLPAPVAEDSPMTSQAPKVPSTHTASDPSTSETSFDLSERGRSSGVTTPTTVEDERQTTNGMKRVHSGEFSQTERDMELLHSNTSQSTLQARQNKVKRNDSEEEHPDLVHRESSVSFDEHSLHLPVAQHSRTPSRTKRRSVSSTLTLERRMSHHSASGQYQSYAPEDYLELLKTERPARFSTPSEKHLLTQLNDLGFDIGQLRHSVETDACDASAAMWWLMRAKQVDRGETDEVVEARLASAARKREKLAAYARDERRKAREKNDASREPSRDVSPDEFGHIPATVTFAEDKKADAYKLAPPIVAPLSASPEALPSVTIPVARPDPKPAPNDSPVVTTPVRDNNLLSSPTDSSPRAGKTRSPSMSMLQRATSAFLGGKGEHSEETNSPTKLHRPAPKRGLTKSESDSTILTTATGSPAPSTIRPKAVELPRPTPQQPEAGPSKIVFTSAQLAAAPAAASNKGNKKDSMWTSWSSFRQFFNEGGQRRKRVATPTDGRMTPQLVLSRGAAARAPHVNRYNTAASVSRRQSMDVRPGYSRRSSSLNSRRSSAASIHLPSEVQGKMNSHDNLQLHRRASQKSHGSQTPTSDREQQRDYEFGRPDSALSGRRRDSARSSISRDMRSPSMQSEGSFRFSQRQPASPLHSYQRRSTQGTASTRIRHIRVIPESQILRTSSVASSIKSNPSSRASSVDGRRDDSDYDTDTNTRRGREDKHGSGSLAKQIHRRSSLAPHAHHGSSSGHGASSHGHSGKHGNEKTTLKPKAPIRDVFQPKDDDWVDEDDSGFAGGLGQARGGGSHGTAGNFGVRWMNGFRAAQHPSSSTTPPPGRRASAGPKDIMGKKKRPAGTGGLERQDEVDESHGSGPVAGATGAGGSDKANAPMAGSAGQGRRGLPARGAPGIIEEEEEEEEE